MSVLKAQIRTVDGNGQPTGVILATSDPVEVASITRDAFYSFSFSSPIAVTPDTQTYAVVLTLDDSVYVSSESEIGWLYSNSSNPYADGLKWKYAGGSWTKSDEIDQFFKIFYTSPQVATSVEHSWTFDSEYARQFFVSTDNTMELDMRFHVSFCIDGSGSMNWSDANNLRSSETLLFIRELMRRSPFSYVDIWTFDNYISESTFEGPTRDRAIYSASLGSIDSTGTESRLWAGAEQAIGALNPSTIVDAIIRDSYVDTVLDLMRQMNRIDYSAMESIDGNYDSSTGFAGISKYGKIVDYIVNDYAETMGNSGIIMSDGYDNDATDDYNVEDIAITANAVREDYWTPLHCFALGSNYKSEEMYYLTDQTQGYLFQIGEDSTTKLREAFNELLNDTDKTMFKGIYEDEVWFDELTFLSSIELGAIVPATTALTFEISLSYDGLTFEEWQTIPSNTLYSLQKFVMAFKIKITGWLGNIYGGNYYDIYGLVENDPTVEDEFTILCRYADYYGYDSYQYYTTSDGYYYYRSTDYPSPKVYSLRYWTIDPSVTYKFTEVQNSPVISEYVFSPNIDLPDNVIMNWGVVRGDSTDPDDLETIISNRMGLLPNRKKSLYYTPDVHQVGLTATPVSQVTNGVLIYRVIDSGGSVVTWTDDDVVTVKVNGFTVDPDVVPYQLVGVYGMIHWLNSPRASTDVVTVDITTPGAAHTRDGELLITTNRRSYYTTNGSWPWDATATVRVNGSIRNSGFKLYPEEGLVLFFNELDAADVVTVEIQHEEKYRIGYQLKNYTTEEIDEPDFAFMYSKEADTETALIASLTTPPQALGVTLSPSSPSLADRIILDYEFYQEDNNAEIGTTIEWYVKRLEDESFSHYSAYDNRNVMRTADTPANNPSGPFQEFDSWYVIVTPKDVNETGTPVQSNTVVIGGYLPPYIVPIEVSGSLFADATIIAATGDDALERDNNGLLTAGEQALVASYTYQDPNTSDSDSDASTIEWYKNGESTASYTSIYPDVTLPVTYVKTGQVWNFVVTPYDGNNYGYRYSSEEVIITEDKD